MKSQGSAVNIIQWLFLTFIGLFKVIYTITTSVSKSSEDSRVFWFLLNDYDFILLLIFTLSSEINHVRHFTFTFKFYISLYFVLIKKINF